MGISMRDALGDVQSVLVLGGNSEIGIAVVDALATGRLRRVTLAARDLTAAEATVNRLADLDISAKTVSYDATDPTAHHAALEAAGEVDVVIVAFGLLGPAFDVAGSIASTAEVADVNFSAAVTASHAAAAHLRGQGHGALVILSSVAGVRTRSENAAYGAAKAGLDAFASALTDGLHGSGVHVLTVRPGFVHSKMTEGMDPAPFSTTPRKVAEDIVAGLRSGQTVVWSPSALRSVFAGLRRMPRPLWRRLGR